MNERHDPQPRGEEWSYEQERAYAEWLMQQPEAHICNGKMLLARIEQGWRWDEFLAQRSQII